MTFKVIRGQGQGEEMTSVPYRDYFLSDLTLLFGDRKDIRPIINPMLFIPEDSLPE